MKLRKSWIRGTAAAVILLGTGLVLAGKVYDTRAAEQPAAHQHMTAAPSASGNGAAHHHETAASSNVPAARTQMLGEDQNVREVHLYAGDLMQEMSKGVTIYSWGYGLWDPKANAPATPPSVPGPELRFKEGEAVRIVFHNEQLEPHTIHFHGIDNSFAGDGTPGLSQHEVAKGDSFTYEFVAPTAGTYFYHCHVEPDRHPEMGLYGAIIVEPKEPTRKVDGEFTWMLSERDPKLALSEGSESLHYPGTAAEGMSLNAPYDTVDRVARYYTINGKIDPEAPMLHVKEGGTYLLRLINAGADVHSIHLHGHHMQVIATDGRDVPQPYSKDTVTLGPGEKYDVLLTANNPGAWPIHCHMGPHGTHGMHSLLVYDGFEEHAAAHHQVSPLSDLKHQWALIKQYQFEKNNEAMKTAAEGLKEPIKSLSTMLSLKNPELLEQLESVPDDLEAQLKGTPDPTAVSSLVNELTELLNKLDQMLGGDLS